MRRDLMLCDLRIDAKDLRPGQRRATEQTETFRVEHRKRGGIEATNILLKRVTGLRRLRVRGRPAVFMSTLLKVGDWNIRRAASLRSLLKKRMKGGQMGQSAMLLILRHHRLVASSRLLVA